jgi:hypothetical protein
MVERRTFEATIATFTAYVMRDRPQTLRRQFVMTHTIRVACPLSPDEAAPKPPDKPKARKAKPAEDCEDRCRC